MGFKTPVEGCKAMETAAANKAKLSFDQQFFLGLAAGLWIAFGGYLSAIGGFNPGLAANGMVGLQKFIFGALFPIGLMLTIWTGSELFTGNTFIMTMGLLQRKITILDYLKNFFWSYVGNIVGTFIVVYLFFYLPQEWNWLPGGSGNADPVTSWADAFRANLNGIAVMKTHRHLPYVFLLAVGANLFVCAAIWCNFLADDLIGKFAGIWFPIAAFVTMGLEHSIANMFFVVIGIFYTDDDWSTWNRRGELIWRYLVYLAVVSIGNMVGGQISAFHLWYNFSWRPRYSLTKLVEKAKHRIARKTDSAAPAPAAAAPTSSPAPVDDKKPQQTVIDIEMATKQASVTPQDAPKDEVVAAPPAQDGPK